MFEKILQKLKSQREKNSNVTDRSLEDLARSLEPVITTDDILEKMDLTASIKSIDGNISHYTADAVKNAKKKEDDAAAAKKKEDEEEERKKQQQQKPTEEMPAWAKTIVEQNEKLTNSLNTLHTEKATSTRKSELMKSLVDKDGKELPEFYTKPILSAFDQTKFESDDEFNNYLGSIKSNTEDFSQHVKEQGITFGIPGKDAELPEETGETGTLSEARKVVKEQKEQQQKA